MKILSLTTVIFFTLIGGWSSGWASEEEEQLPLEYQRPKSRKRAPHSFSSQPFSSSPTFSQTVFLEEFEIELQNLNKLILEILQAKENIPLTQKLLLKEQENSWPNELRAQLQDILRRAELVEDMLVHDNRDKVLTVSSLNEEDDCLRGFIYLLQDITSLLQQELIPPLREPLYKLKRYYQHIIDKLCMSTPEERRILLTQRAKLTGERLKHYLIPQHLARETLSRTINGLSIRELKEQQAGQNAVACLKGLSGNVHFKVGTSLSGINPPMEWAIHCFSCLLMGQGTAPSACLTIENVYFRPFNGRDYAHDPEAKEAQQLFNKFVIFPKPEERITVEEFFTRFQAFEKYFTQSTGTAVVQASRTIGDPSIGDFSLKTFLDKVASGEKQISELDPASYSWLFPAL